jgi:GDP-L-fucose synthase
MDKESKILVSGHRGLVGSAILRKLSAGGYRNTITRTRDELDLTDQQAVNSFFDAAGIEYVFCAAAKVGGILANSTCPADFIRENLLIQTLVMDAAFRSGVKKLLFLGSSCVYPRNAAQPITEDQLLTSALEPTNQAYAIAKIAGIAMAQAYRRQYGNSAICLMPTNLYGPGDNFDPNSSHVLPALIRKFHEAKVSRSPHVTVWGTGAPRREFLHVDDLADATVHMMLRYDDAELLNIGSGRDLTIAELAKTISEIVGYDGEIVFDDSKPDGMPRKLLDVTRAAKLGWRPSIELSEGIARTYQWALRNGALR